MNILCYKIRPNIHGPSKQLLSSENCDIVIFALWTSRKNIIFQDASVFDTCNLNNVELYLNSDFYVYYDLNLDFDKKRYTILFDMYARFRKAYYGISTASKCYSMCSLSRKNLLRSLTARNKTNPSRTPP